MRWLNGESPYKAVEVDLCVRSPLRTLGGGSTIYILVARVGDPD